MHKPIHCTIHVAEDNVQGSIFQEQKNGNKHTKLQNHFVSCRLLSTSACMNPVSICSIFLKTGRRHDTHAEDTGYDMGMIRMQGICGADKSEIVV